MAVRATTRVIFAIVMMAMLMATNSLLAVEQDAGGESIEGYCQTREDECHSRCYGSWYMCRERGVADPETCQDQYYWCRDDCWGAWGDFWCGYWQN